MINRFTTGCLSAMCLIGTCITSLAAVDATYTYNAGIADGAFTSADYLPVNTVVKVFDAISIADIKDGNFSARMGGGWITVNLNDKTSAKVARTIVASGYYVTETADGLTVQFQIQDGTYVKCAKVLFSDGADGVYAKVLSNAYKNKQAIGINTDTTRDSTPAPYGSDATGKDNAYGVAAITVGPSLKYQNKLAGSDAAVYVPEGTYGNIDVSGCVIKATAFGAGTVLESSGTGISGSYSSLIITGSNYDSHSAAGWFKIASFPSSGYKPIWGVANTDTNKCGYVVLCDSSGKIGIAQATSSQSGTNFTNTGTAYFSSQTVIEAGKWSHLALSVMRDPTRKATVRLFVNGADAGLISTANVGTDCNGDAGCAHFSIGAGISAAGLYIDNGLLLKPELVQQLATDATYVETSTLTDYAATISANGNWTALAWSPDWPSGGDRLAVANLTASETSTVTVDAVEAMYKLNVSSASGKMLTIKDAAKLNADEYDFSAAKEGVGFDVTTATFTPGDALKTYLREHDERYTFFGNGKYGVNMDYGSGWNNYCFAGHYVFDGGTHTFKNASSVKNLKFGVNATVDNPTLWVRNGAKLTWKSKDPCGWELAANTNGIARIGDGSKISVICVNTSRTWYWAQQFYLESGSELEIGTVADKMAFTGGVVENNEQLYVPESAGGMATVSATGSGQFRLANAGAAAFVGAGSTLRVTAPLVSAGTTEVLAKKGSGTLKLEGSLADFGGSLQAAAGVVELASTNGFASGAAVDVAAGATVKFSGDDDRMFDVVVSGDGALVKEDEGTLTLEGSLAEYGGSVRVDAGVLEIATTSDFANGAAVAVAEGATLMFSADDDTTFGADVSGAGSLVKDGNGTLTLAGANTYTGTTTVSNGTLAIKTGVLGSGFVTIGPEGEVRFIATADELVNGVTLFRTQQELSEIEGRLTVAQTKDGRTVGVFSKVGDDVRFIVATEPIPSAPAVMEHATYQVFTNGALSVDGTVLSNLLATVVYTADAGYVFTSGRTVVTNELDTTVAPAMDRTPPGGLMRLEDILALGDFNFGSMTFPRAAGLDFGSYRQLTIMFSREMSGESLSFPTVEGYTLNTDLSTDYSYVIDIAEPGKTAGEIAQYIRQIVFNGCRDQHVRIVLDEAGASRKTFYFDGTRHYYQYVPFVSGDDTSWEAAYRCAKGMTYCGRQGYLATVMSRDEDVFVYKGSAGVVGWLGGTSLVLGGRDGQYYDVFTTTVSNAWYWACGPECGTEFFDCQPCGNPERKRNNASYVRNLEKGYYINWNYASSASSPCPEPNNYSGTEACLTTLPLGKGVSTVDVLSDISYSWNDINPENSDNKTYKAQGFVVEFGNQPTGDTSDGSFVPGYVMVERDIRAPVITYDAGAGTFPDGETTNAVTILYAPDGYVLPTNAPTLDGSSLAGWYLDPNNRSTFVMAGSPLYSQEDHTVYALWQAGGTTNVEVDVGGGETGYVNLSEDELENRGGDPNKIEANLNRVWENMVMGLESNKYVVTGARQHPNEHKLTGVAVNLEVPPANSGVTVRYHLDRVSRDGRTRREEESSADSPTGLLIDLDRIETNEYFKVRVVLSQTNESGKVLMNREFVATNTLGVLNVKKAPTKTIVSVPWGQLGIGDAEVKIADLVKTATLTPGDRLYAYRFGDTREFPYDAWELDAGYQWTPATLVNIDADSQAAQAVTGAAADETIARGSACWLVRQDTSRPVYLYGQVETNATVQSAIQANASGKPCWNLIGSPRVTPLDLNVQFPEGCEGDQIIVPTDSAPKNYLYKGGRWGYYVTEPYLDGVRSRFKTDDTIIAPGLGMWYINNGPTEKTVVW